MAAASVRDNKSQSRFELDVEGGGRVRELSAGAGRRYHHPYRDAAQRCAAAASPRNWSRARWRLIRADGLKVVAGCGFVVDYLQSIRSLQIWRLNHRRKQKGARRRAP